MNFFCAAILELCIIFVRERQSFVSALDLCIDGINWLSCSPLMCFDFSNILSKSNFMANYFGIGAIGVQYLMLATMSWVHAVEVSSIWWVAWLEHLCLRSLKTDSRSLCMSASCQIKVVFFFFFPLSIIKYRITLRGCGIASLHVWCLKTFFLFFISNDKLPLKAKMRTC